ncbi:precorrin-8X methylmutase [Desulfurivibrio alkaliphilus]|uniref:Precorrin-8X methylmutase CbiC/CobH n=1 Tax=Desulfurivibrio alkaliphilus (strain DSM 19089 / UNIQEM U267 / AHT2) TaxID=589865 RepID=D6Z402_DESAT|nr:precorrin-8X methylmutase [Desulfurivibrio alkaliphilus]ADH86277.1 Precorrin-8X methylmutase CbiC/CobH [Desulfurivibrio alkaliphilus AHT 2]
MSTIIQQIKPADIEAESFRIIDREHGAHPFDAATWSVVRRVIHATGDFSFADTLRFAPGALAAGLAAIRAGKNILTDVNMTASGISKHLLARYGGKVLCGVADPEVAEQARRRGLTRSEVAIDLLLPENIGIVAIGNAPTALLRVMERRQTLAPEQRPELIIGVPVGFVNAAESKELLSQREYPHITALGRKGGSPTAAAIVNALLRLAVAESG